VLSELMEPDPLPRNGAVATAVPSNVASPLGGQQGAPQTTKNEYAPRRVDENALGHARIRGGDWPCRLGRSVVI
jgi:hypothetical protein